MLILLIRANRGVIKTVCHVPGLYGVRRRASLAAALHMAVTDTFKSRPCWPPLEGALYF